MKNKFLTQKNEVFNRIVLDAIKKGGVVKGSELAIKIGHKDTRQIRLAIQQLRTEGEPICIGKSGGYYYSKEKEDVEATINQLLSRAEELIIVAEGLKKVL